MVLLYYYYYYYYFYKTTTTTSTKPPLLVYGMQHAACHMRLISPTVWGLRWCNFSKKPEFTESL